MPNLRSLCLTLGALSLPCLALPAILSGCSAFKSKEQRAAERAKAAFRQESGQKQPDAVKVAGKTDGNPRWKQDIDDSLTKARSSVPGNSTAYNPSGPPPRGADTNVKIDLSRAKSTTYHSVNVGGNYIALTFDDGPHPTNTPRLLDMLKERNIKATFFVVGPNAKRYPEIMKRIVAEGHEIGNHTMTHGLLTKMSNDQIRGELDGCRSAIVNSCGVNPRIMRAPYGSLTNAQKIFIKDTWGYPNIHWSVDPEDWKRPGPSVVANRILSNTRAGGIVLVHDIHAPSVVAMPETLDGLLRKGFSFVTTSQLISLGSAASTAAAAPAAAEIGTATPAAAIPGEPVPAVPLPSTDAVGDERHARIED